MRIDGRPAGVRAWFVYIIRAADDTLYTGVTTDVARRLREHLGGGRGSRYLRGRQPLEVVYTERQADRGSAQRREWEIKKLTREEKLALIARSGENRQGAPVDE